MNLEELKTAWSAFDQQIQQSNRIQNEVITSMIATRSSSRFSTIRKNYVIGMAWIAVCMLAGIVVLTTNPFDYVYGIQYLPLVLYTICLLIILAGMTRGYVRLNGMTVEKNTLEASLRNIIKEYERPRAMMKNALLVLLFSAVVLFPLSFLPANIKSMGWGIALAERLIPMAISVLLLFVAYRLGAFKEKDAPRFREDLDELEQLKAMARELKS
jgi:hypothetical protein